MTVSLALLLRTAQESFDRAKEAADAIRLSAAPFEAFGEIVKNAAYRTKALREQMLSDKPQYERLKPYMGLKAWGALASFDLRKSSELATLVSPRDMYLVMHTYLPTCLAVVEQSGGVVVGLRGDGAIVCFGLVDVGEGQAVNRQQAETAVTAACDCGDAIVKAMQKVINPVLAREQIRKGKELVGVGRGQLQVGIGIDVGEIVATRIGLGGANELTAYGVAVNHCCKRSYGNDMVILTKRAKDTFPEATGGRTGFRLYPDKTDDYILRYPDDYNTLL
jgi:hypothetical protein